MSADARASVVLALDALRDGDTGYTADCLRDALDALPIIPPHACALCRSDCDEVLRLRRLVRQLEAEAQRVAYALVQERELRAWAASEIEARFPGEVAA